MHCNPLLPLSDPKTFRLSQIIIIIIILIIYLDYSFNLFFFSGVMLIELNEFLLYTLVVGNFKELNWRFSEDSEGLATFLNTKD